LLGAEKDLVANSAYAQDGVISCEIIKESKGPGERTIFHSKHWPRVFILN